MQIDRNILLLERKLFNRIHLAFPLVHEADQIIPSTPFSKFDQQIIEFNKASKVSVLAYERFAGKKVSAVNDFKNLMATTLNNPEMHPLMPYLKAHLGAGNYAQLKIIPFNAEIKTEAIRLLNDCIKYSIRMDNFKPLKTLYETSQKLFVEMPAKYVDPDTQMPNANLAAGKFLGDLITGINGKEEISYLHFLANCREEYKRAVKSLGSELFQDACEPRILKLWQSSLKLLNELTSKNFISDAADNLLSYLLKSPEKAHSL